MVFPGDKYLIFHLVSKTVPTEQQTIVHLKSSILSLKYLIDSVNVKTISISKFRNNLAPIKRISIEQLLKEIFRSSQYIITVCTGEIVIPPPVQVVNETKCSQQRRNNQCVLLILLKGLSKRYRWILLVHCLLLIPYLSRSL